MTKRNPSTSNASPAAPRRRPAPAAVRPAARQRRQWWRRWRPARVNSNALLLAGTGLVILAALGLLGYGYWDSYIRPARATAVRVGDRAYDSVYFTRRLKLALSQPTGSEGGARSAQEIELLLTTLSNDILEEEVFVQRAASLGVGIPDDEIDGFMAERLAVPFSRDEEGRIQYSRSFENGVRARLQRSGLTLAEFRRSLHGQRLRQEVRRHFERSVPEAAPAARIRLISLDDEEKAKDVKQQLDRGGDFAELASGLSTDGETRAQGGLSDWTPKGLLPAELDQVAFDLPEGRVSDPIKSGDKWVVLRVEERAAARQLTDKERSDLAARQFDDWLAAQKAELNARNYTEKPDVVRYAVNQSGALEEIRRSQRRDAIPQSNVTVVPGGAPAPGGGVPPAPPGGGTR